MESGKIKVNSENIFPIIKKWLYTEQDIFIREIISNSCDAITKFKKLISIGEAAEDGGGYAIRIGVSKKAKTIAFTDNGIGMTAEEVDKYINQLAFSGAEDFIAKYSDTESSGIIGHFGLGFYSSFIVSERVEIDTLSYLPSATAVHWVCDGSTEYTLDVGSATARGTTVTLHIGADGKKYLDASVLTGILRKYCAYLPYGISVTDLDAKDKTPVSVNESPLFVKQYKDITDDEYKAFYKSNFADYRDPLFWVHINVDYPFNMKGILYFPEVNNIPAQNDGLIKVYNNQVFVTDNVKDLVPEYLGVLKGMLDCADMPLNVSRSSLQNTEYWRKVRTHIIKKTAEKIRSLCIKDFESYKSVWDKINGFLKFGCITDDDFYKKIKDALILKTTDGEYIKLADLTDKKKLFYVNSPSNMGAFLSGYKAAGHTVYLLDQGIDTHFISFLERTESDLKFARIDSEADALKGDGGGDAQTGEKITDEFKKVIGEGLKIEAQPVNSDMPCLILSGEDASRMQTMGRLMGMAEGFRDERLLINTASPVIKRLTDNPDANEIRYCYDLARLSVGALAPTEVNGFIELAVSLLKRS
ncbi:MAG: molecular chaperone HtpG [Clostridiales bacterium]|jgi:molecular chaperone HtpG|nr:molecular chaperone HtpG [Clostridiales bacterium]